MLFKTPQKERNNFAPLVSYQNAGISSTPAFCSFELKSATLKPIRHLDVSHRRVFKNHRLPARMILICSDRRGCQAYKSETAARPRESGAAFTLSRTLSRTRSVRPRWGTSRLSVLAQESSLRGCSWASCVGKFGGIFVWISQLLYSGTFVSINVNIDIRRQERHREVVGSRSAQLLPPYCWIQVPVMAYWTAAHQVAG